MSESLARPECCIPCPECQGAGLVNGIACGPDGCDMRGLPCSLCDGLGRVSQETIERRERGRALRDLRVGRDLSLRELAKFLELRPVELSEIERGKKEPSQETRRALESLFSQRKGQTPDTSPVSD